jgi:hypothetical protein
MRNNEGLSDKLKNGPYAEPALVPEYPVGPVAADGQIGNSRPVDGYVPADDQ